MHLHPISRTQIDRGKDTLHTTLDKWVCGASCCVALAASFLVANSEAATSLQISQIADGSKELSVFLRFDESTGAVAKGAASGKFEAALGSLPLTVKGVSAYSAAQAGIALVVAIDVSASLNRRNFEQIKKVVIELVQQMPQRSRVALIAIGSEVRTIKDFTGDFTSVTSAISVLSPSDQETSLYEAIVKAQEVAARIDTSLPTRRAVLVITDGIDDSHKGYSKEEVMRRIGEGIAPVYSIGLVKTPNWAAQQDALKALAQLSRASGGDYVQATGESLAASFKALKGSIEIVQVAALDCGSCIRDGISRRLQIVYNDGNTSITDSRDVRLLVLSPAVPIPQPDKAKSKATKDDTWLQIQRTKVERLVQIYPWLPWALGGTLSLLVLLGVAWLVRASAKRRALIIDGSNPNLHGWGSAIHMPGEDGAPNVRGDSTLEEERTTTARHPSSGRSITLAVAGQERKVISLDRSITIGRANNNSISIPNDTESSARHAEIAERKGIPVLADLGSTNGSYLNGTRIVHPEPLADGDLVVIGRTEIRIYFS